MFEFINKKTMFILKRDKTKQKVSFDKITERINALTYGLNIEYVDPIVIAKKVISGIYAGVTTTELDELAAETAAYMSTRHPDFSILASRISVSNLHKNTSKNYKETVEKLYKYKYEGESAPMVSKEFYTIVCKYENIIQDTLVYSRDYTYDYFGFKTLCRSYLLKIDGNIIERPQHMLMRVAIGIQGDDIEKIIETYNILSEKWYTHATPTLFNAGTTKPQLSSCYLLCTKEDSVDGIYDTLKQCAQISKFSGGIGLSVHDVRSNNSYIRGTSGHSSGIIPMLKVFNSTARYINQGGKRKGSIAIYIEPWHADIFDFLDLKKNHGIEEMRARDLFYALWIPDLFMKRVEEDGYWSLFCPDKARGLSDVHSEEFEKLFLKYEKEGRAIKTIKAQKLWFAILESQIETGTPYMLYKDACNMKSNQKNLGTIKSSNLCAEIVEYSSSSESAVCNLSSINLSKFVNTETKTFDYDKLGEITEIAIRNLNKVIDVNFYPTEETLKSNMLHRPVGLGVQAFADVLIMMSLPFECEEAIAVNKKIFETMYYYALKQSNTIAMEEGWYQTFPGSPASKGILQFDLWGVKPATDRYDWDGLKKSIIEHGIRNSLLIALMPTASTAQILGNNESFEPYTSNMYTRRVLAGEFTIINKHLIKDLIKLDLWNDKTRNDLMSQGGSVQNIEHIPKHIKDIYKTVWEVKQKALIDMCSDRGAYIDQSQSFNVHIADPDYAKLTSMHFYGWKSGLKTGMYYLRTRPKVNPIQFTVDKSMLSKPVKEDKAPVCNMELDCLMCGS
jgi:ribonucleoside-diphosphate reductase alpha subunit